MEFDSEKAAGLSVKLSLLVTTVLSLGLFALGHPVLGLLSWVLMLPLAWLISFAIGTYARHQGAVVQEVKQLWLSEEELECSDEVLGTYQGADIHAWVRITRPDDGTPITLRWARTVDLDRDGFEPPDDQWFVLIAPGLLYTEGQPGESSAA